MKSVAEQIEDRIAENEPEWCFSQKDFMDLAGRDALDKAFSRLCRAGAIRRIGRGLYDVPRYSELLTTMLSPSADEIAKAVARKFGWRIIPTGAHAANMLNLSTQVPVKMVYHSDGPSKEMTFGNRTVYFEKTSPKKLAASELGGLLINALKYLGKEQVTSEIMTQLNRRFDETQKRQLLEDARFGTDWMFEVIQNICNEGKNHE